MPVLEDFVIAGRVNEVSEYSGMDSPMTSFDEEWTAAYPYKVDYKFNSRGLRDNEWPLENLDKHIWCFGDSFTVGLGSPREHTWPFILSRKTGTPTLNCSMDGASNNWIARRAVQVMQEIKPNVIVILWSFFHRRESANTKKTDEERRMHFDPPYWNVHMAMKDVDNFISCVNLVSLHRGQTKIIHATIPHAMHFSRGVVLQMWEEIKDHSWPKCPEDLDSFSNLAPQLREEIEQNYKDIHIALNEYYKYDSFVRGLDNFIGEVEQIDKARDGFHFDIQTSSLFVHKIMSRL